MVHEGKDDGAWFAPKRYGLGSGLPIRWQGWLVYALGFAAIAGARLLPNRPAGWAITAVVILAMLVITARHTRGGWKWRWGGE